VIKPSFKKIEFYITNVCNLTCDHCNRFNNHDFRGWQRWSDYEAIYERWAQLIDLNSVTIMGGEPFLNPTLPDWIRGINRIFGVSVQILTNGTRFRYATEVYRAMHEGNQLGLGTPTSNNHIAVSLHNLDDFEQLRSDVAYFLGNKPLRENHSGFNQWGSDWQWIDENDIMINVYKQNVFQTSAIERINNRFVLYNSDPELAHDACTFAKFKSYHFVRGALYKCGPVALFPEFDQQHTFLLSQEDRQLLNSYRPLTVENFEEYHKEFLANLDNSIPQCKFCPVLHTPITISPLPKGSVKADKQS
jgi:organic radical activating enzyme